MPDHSSAERKLPAREGKWSKTDGRNNGEPSHSDSDDDDASITTASTAKAAVALLIVCVDLATAVMLAFCWWLRTSAFSLGYGLIFGYLVILRPTRYSYDDPTKALRIPRGWLAAFMNAALATTLHIVFGLIDLLGGFSEKTTNARTTAGRKFVDLGLLPAVGHSRFGFMLPDLLIVAILGSAAGAYYFVRRRRAQERLRHSLAAKKPRISSHTLVRTVTTAVTRRPGVVTLTPSSVVRVSGSVQPLNGSGGSILRQRPLQGHDVSESSDVQASHAHQRSPGDEMGPSSESGRSPDKDAQRTDLQNGKTEADAELRQASPVSRKTREKIVTNLTELANKVRTIWRKNFKFVRRVSRAIPIRYITTLFVRDGVAVLCIATALYDSTIFAIPYIMMPGVYVQMWIHDSSGAAKRRADKVVAHFALFDLFAAYLSLTETVGQPMRDLVATMNQSPWLETQEPKWDSTSCALRMWIIVGFSFINLVPNRVRRAVVHRPESSPALFSRKTIDANAVRVAQFFLKDEDTLPFLNWLQGAVLIVSFVLCLILWSVLAVTPTSLLTLTLAWFTVVWYKRFRTVSKAVMVCVQVIVFLQWCVGLGGLKLPIVADTRADNWSHEASHQVTMGMITVALLAAWYVHNEHYGLGSDKHRQWRPHMKTLHKINSFQRSMRAVVVVVLNICGLGQASGIHAVYVLAGRAFQMMDTLHYRAWVVLASFAYVSIGAGLIWLLLYPPVYEFGECDELVAAYNCSTPMSALAAYLPDDEYVRDECDKECGVYKTTKLDQGGWEEVGIHACSTAADCRFASFGWSTMVALAVSMQIGISNFGQEHRDRLLRKLKQHEENKQKADHELERRVRDAMQREEEYVLAHKAWLDAGYRRILRSISLIIIVWAFTIAHLTTTPRLANAWIFATVLTFCVAYMKLGHKLDRPAARNLLHVLWSFLSFGIIFWGILEYAYTLKFARTALNTLFIDGLRLNQTATVSVNRNETIVRYSGFLNEQELGLHVDRQFGEQVLFFSLVINGVFAYLGVTNFEKMYGPRVKVEPKTADNESKQKLKRRSSKAATFFKKQLNSSKLKLLSVTLNKLATLNAPKFVLIITYLASQVEPLKVIYAAYLLPVAFLLSFGPNSCKRIWHVLALYAWVAWVVTYVWQFQFCRTIMINDFWGLTVLDDMWDERLLVHVWVLVSVGCYRALGKGQRFDKLSLEPLFEGAWPHLSSNKLDTSEDPWLRLKFVASHFLLAFGQTIFFTTCLLAATLRRDNFSVLFVLNLSVFFLKNRRRILKGMQVNFVLLVVVQILVCAAALTAKIFESYGVEDPDFPGGDFVAHTMDAFLYFSRNDNDDNATVVDESLNGPSFVILFVMSSILYNEKKARAMVKQHDQKLLALEVRRSADGNNYNRAWEDGRTGEQRLLDTIERLCFVYSIQLDRKFRTLDKVKINDKFVHACSLEEFVSRVKKVLGKYLKKHIKDDSQLTSLIRKLGQSDPWACPREFDEDGVIRVVQVNEFSSPLPSLEDSDVERVYWLRFCMHVSADIQDRMLSWSANEALHSNGENAGFQAKVSRLFDRFDTDSNGYLDLEEHKRMYQTLEGELPPNQSDFDQEYATRCKQVDADPDKGLNVKQFMCMYKKGHQEQLGSDLSRDYNVAFPNGDSPAAWLLKAGWSAVLIVAVDCMALVIGLVCLLNRDSFSLIMGGYLVAALFFLRVQRSEHDSEVLWLLHKYTFAHILVQSLFLFFDPLLGFTENEQTSEALINLIGLEPKNITQDVSVYTLAAWLFAWIIAVSELQKTQAYEAMRLNMQYDQDRATARLFLAFTTRMIDQQRAAGRIDKTLLKLAVTEKRIRSRRNSTFFLLDSFQNEAKNRWRAAYTKLKSDTMFATRTARGPRLIVMEIETKGLEKHGPHVKVELRIGSEPSLVTDTASPNTVFKYPNEHISMDFKPNNTGLPLHAKILTIPSHKVYGIVTVHNLNKLQSGDVVDEWYHLHHITSIKSRSKGQVRLKFKLDNWDHNSLASAAIVHEQVARQRKVAAAMTEDVKEITPIKFSSCTVLAHGVPESLCGVDLEKLWNTTVDAELKRRGLKVDAYWKDVGYPFTLQVTVRRHDQGSDGKKSRPWALITYSNEKAARAVVKLETLATGPSTAPIFFSHVDYELALQSDGAFIGIWQQSKAKTEVELEHRLSARTRTKRNRGHPDLREWARDRHRHANSLENVDLVDTHSLFSELSKLLGMSRFAPRRLAARVIMARKKHMGMSSKAAWAELAGSSTAENVAIFAHHVILTNSERICYMMVILNQWVNANVLSAVYFVTLVGFMMCEDPCVPPGFWAVLVFCLQVEIILRYVLSIQYLSFVQTCTLYKEKQASNAELVEDSSHSFICKVLDPEDHIEMLLVLMVCVLVHEYRMKRLGVWIYWTPFFKSATKQYQSHKNSVAEVAASGIEQIDKLPGKLKRMSSSRSQDAESHVSGVHGEVLAGSCKELSNVNGGTITKDEEQPFAPSRDAHEDYDTSELSDTPVDEESLHTPSELDAGEDEETLQRFEQAVVAVLAVQRRLSAFVVSFYSNVVRQDQMLPPAQMEGMQNHLKKSRQETAARAQSPANRAAVEAAGTVLSVAPITRKRRKTYQTTSGNGAEVQPIAALFRKNSHKVPVDLYPQSLLVEFLSMAVVAFGLDTDLTSDALENVSTSNFIDARLIWMTILQFLFIVMDRAANLKQSIPFKLCVQWLSLIVYMPIIFNVWEWNHSLATLFILKTIYWVLGAIQIRKSYPHDTSTGSRSTLVGELHQIRQYSAMLVHAIPFVDHMRSVLGWVFNETTMRWEDCVRFDEIMSMMFLVRCKFARLDELNLKRGEPLRATHKLAMGSFLLLQFFVYAWGPMIIITFIDSIIGTNLNNVRSASVQMDLYIGGTAIPIFDTKYSDVSGVVPGREPREHEPIFVLPGYPDDVDTDHYTAQGETLCKKKFQPAMEDFDPHDLYNTRCDTGAFKLFSADAFDTLQVVQFGEYSDTSWSPSIQRRKTSLEALENEMTVSYMLKFQFETPNNTVTPPPYQEQGKMDGETWASAELCTPRSPQCNGKQCSLKQAWNLQEGQTNRDVLKLMFSEHPNLFDPVPNVSTLCVPGGNHDTEHHGFNPLLKLSADAEPSTIDDEDTSRARFCLCLVTDMALDRRVWQLLQAYGPAHTLPPPLQDGRTRRGLVANVRDTGQVQTSAGLAVLTDSQKIPTGVGQSVANLGLVGLYVTVVFNMARGVKLARERLLRNLVYDDRDAADFIYQLCHDLLTVRKLAKLNADFFLYEEMLWLKLQTYLRDHRELLSVTQQAKQDRLSARHEELTDSSEEEGDDSRMSDGNDSNDDGDNNQNDGGQLPPPPRSPSVVSRRGRLRGRRTHV